MPQMVCVVKHSCGIHTAGGCNYNGSCGVMLSENAPVLDMLMQGGAHIQRLIFQLDTPIKQCGIGQ